MNQKLKKNLNTDTVSLEEFSRIFTPAEKRLVEDEIRYYHVLVSLRQARQKLGLTQSQLAERAKIPRTTITKVESGKYNPTISTLMNMAAAMDKTLQIKVV